MSDRLLLDTHIVLWLDAGDARLTPSTIGRIEACWGQGGSILISAITAYEVAQLASRRRILIDVPAELWLKRLSMLDGVETVPLTPTAAAQAYSLDGFDHGDPADRLLIATAIETQCPLVTYDARILNFARDHGTTHGFQALS